MMQAPELLGGQTTQIDPSVDSGKRRRSKSKVWKEFTPVLNSKSAECKHCRKLLSANSSGGTSHLSRHLKICPARPGTNTNQPHCSPPEALEELSRATSSDLCLFPIMSSAGFRHVLAGLYPTSSMISTEEQFITMFQNEKMKLKEKIAFTPGGVFLSVGRWKLEANGFTCLTVHFIDRDWQMHRKIVRCFCSEVGDDEEPEYCISFLPNWKSLTCFSSNRSDVSKATVEEYSLENKLLGIVLPESVGLAVVFKLEKIFTGQNYLLAESKLLNIPCSVHVLHQLFISVRNEVIQKISTKWFEYMTCSPLWKEKYQQILWKMCLHRPSFGSKRWYSTFYLLEAVLQFNKTFPDLVQTEGSGWYPSKPSFETLEAAESFCLVARPIYHAIRVLSSSRSATSSYFHALWSVRTVLQESSGNKCMDRVLDIKDMLKTFDKEWRKLYLWLSVAVVLDPRYKMRFLEQCFRQAYGNGAKTYISDVRGKIYELFFRYSCRADQQSRNNDNYMEMSSHGSYLLDVTYQNYHEQATHENSLKELHAYLDGELCPLNDVNYLSSEALPQNGNFDILKWWKANASIYPALAALARDVLAISACAVSEESAFDETDERVYLFNQKLSHEMAEAVICTKDWFQDSGRSDANGGNYSVPI